MNKLVIILFALFLSSCSAQNVYYGIPDDTGHLNKGDCVVLNFPNHANSKFLSPDDFNDIISMMQKNSTLKFRIELNVFMGASKANYKYSELLAQSMNEIIEFKSPGLKNYSTVPMGDTNPRSKDEDDVLYKERNTRIEIFIE